ncbi:MAG: thiamine phosphate synthase [Bryobacterales bacterium]|nr:thiamine phosphate synthase [Bryobacterales bacterium]MDE0621452.1 thiamine phosphate synthase [Bryobacterales bacterium]
MDARLRSAVLADFPAVYPIIDSGAPRAAGSDPARMASALANAGARIVQYRHKGEFGRRQFEEARAAGEVLRHAGVVFVVNDRADIALALQADGVHVGQDDLPPAEVRRLIGSDILLGYSTHNAAQLSDDACRWADYLAIGPAFHTSSKRNPDPVVGIEGVREARSMTAKPLVAIGGITLSNASEVLAAGADSVSAISGITPGNMAQWMRLGR